MAKASALAPGMEVHVISGPYGGHSATVIDPRPVPDGEEHQRCIKVAINDVFSENNEPFQVYILPRLLTNRREVPMGQYVQPWAPEQRAALTTAQVDVEGVTRLVDVAEPITDPMDPSLDRFRPDANVVKRYISRTLPGGYTDIDYLLAKRDQRDANGYSPNVALVGETQSGKTMLVQVLAVLAALRDGMPKPYPVFTINGSQGVTNYDIYGQTSAVIINGKETLVWMEGIAAMAAKAGGFLYLDEWNAVNPGQAVAMHPVLDDRRQFINTQKAVPDGHGGFSPEVVKVNPKTWVISTINPGYKGTQTMAEATSNRFQWLAWDYDEATEKALIPSKSIRIMGGRLREASAERVLSLPVGTSALMRFNADCAMFGVDNAVYSFTSMFPPVERDRIDAIITDGGLLDLLRDEYPEAMYAPGSHDAVTVGATWAPDSIAHQV